MQPARRLHPALTALIVIVLIGIVASVVIVVNQQDQPKSEDQTTTQTEASSPTSTDTSTYKDGTYSATGSYSTPGGRESIELTVTIANGVITDTSLIQKATDGEAREYQAKFASGYKSQVVGKSVDEVSLSRVAGSSLTSNGFNSALDQIKTDAES